MFRVVIIVVLLLMAQAVFCQERSFQLWNQNSVEASLTAKTSLKLSEKIHYSPGVQSLDLKYADVFLAHELNSWFELGGGYRISGIGRDYGWLTEQRTMVYGEFFRESGKLELNFSNRFEYRAFDKAENHFRHKQKFTIVMPTFTSANLRFFIAEETFEKFTPDNLHLARLYAGMKAFENKQLQMKLYYILEKYKNEEIWNTRDIVGLNFSMEL